METGDALLETAWMGKEKLCNKEHVIMTTEAPEGVNIASDLNCSFSQLFEVLILYK